MKKKHKTEEKMKKILLIVLVITLAATSCLFLTGCKKEESAYGKYYLYEGGDYVLDDYITVKERKWTDSDGNKGLYALYNNKLNFYQVSSGNISAYSRVILKNGIMLLDTLSGDTLVYAKKGRITEKHLPAELTAGLEFERVDGKNEYRVSEYNGGSASRVIIPDSYKGYPITQIKENAFRNITAFTVIDIPQAVTSIGDFAFSGCTGLLSVKIPAQVTEIGEGVFMGCESLASVELPDGLLTIGEEAFRGCKKLEDVVFPDSVSSLGNGAFYDCDSFTEITVGSGVETIGSEAFYSCNSLTSVIFGESVTSLGAQSFRDCGSLTDIEIPDGVTDIGDEAFYNCDLLWSISLGAGVESIGERAFFCKSLTQITVSEDNITFSSREGNLYSNDGTILLQYAIGKDDATFTVPQGVTSIGDFAFYDCDRITGIIVGDDVTEINREAFFDCDSLISVTLGSSVAEVEKKAFYECSNLFEVFNKSSLTIEIGGQNNGYIGFYAKNIYTPTQGQSVLISNADGFILFADNGDTVLIGYIGEATDIVIPEGVTVIYSNAFYDKDFIQSVELPDTVTEIHGNAFSYCDALITVSLNSDVRSIEDFAFSFCFALSTIEFDGTVDEWNEIALGENWSFGSNLVQIICSDENITL